MSGSAFFVQGDFARNCRGWFRARGRSLRLGRERHEQKQPSECACKRKRESLERHGVLRPLRGLEPFQGVIIPPSQVNGKKNLRPKVLLGLTSVCL